MLQEIGLEKKLITRIRTKCFLLSFGAVSLLLRSFRLSHPLNLDSFDKFWFSSTKLRSVLANPSFKQMLDQLQPRFPFKKNSVPNLPEITVVIPAHPKDFILLQAVIDGITLNSRNPIREFLIITPTPEKPGVWAEHSITFLQDKEVLSAQVSNYFQSESSKKLDGWIKQQVLKIETVLSHVTTGHAVVLDADTVILAPRVFTSVGVQELSFATEYHEPYFSHVSRFNGELRRTGLSFVTHYQLWNKAIVRDIWADGKLIDWLMMRDEDHISCISEYQTYGQYLVSNYSACYKFTRWGNVNFSRKSQDVDGAADYVALKRRFPSALSVSVHSYS